MVATYKIAYKPIKLGDNFYGSTQSRLHTYTADRRVEERNGDIQQAKVYQKIAEQQGDIDTADRLAKLATNVINRFGQQVQAQLPQDKQPSEPFDVRKVLANAIDSGTLSQLWDRVKVIPKSQLSHTAQIIQNDIKHNRMLREVLNEKVALYASHKHNLKVGIPSGRQMLKSQVDISSLSGPDDLSDIIQTIGGDNEEAVKELIQKANAGLAEDLMKAHMIQAKHGAHSVASSETSVGTEIGNPSREANITFNTPQEYIQYHEEERLKHPTWYDTRKINNVRAYLRSKFGLSKEDAKTAFKKKA